MAAEWKLRKGSIATAMLALVVAVLLWPRGSPSRAKPVPPAPPRLAKGEVLAGKVVRIGDGDSLTVLKDRTEIKVRLFGIDTPERGQAFADKAREFTAGAVFGKTVSVEVRDTDRYGRTVGIVRWRDDERERDLNAELAAAGLAWAYRWFSTQYVPQEEEARAARRGLWKDANPEPPWEFRKRGAE